MMTSLVVVGKSWKIAITLSEILAVVSYYNKSFVGGDGWISELCCATYSLEFPSDLFFQVLPNGAWLCFWGQLDPAKRTKFEYIHESYFSVKVSG